MLLRQGVFLLATLCLNDRLFVEHRVDVEHQYINVVSSVTRLYKRITGLISEAEGDCSPVQVIVIVIPYIGHTFVYQIDMCHLRKLHI